MMKKAFLSVTRLVSLSAGVGFASLVMAQPTLAQLTSVDPGSSTNFSGNNNPLSNIDQNNFNVYQLMHQAQLGSINWNPVQQNQQLDSAATSFRDAQNQRFDLGNQAKPGLIKIIRTKAAPQNQVGCVGASCL